MHRASDTIGDIQGIGAEQSTASVEDDEITEFRPTVEIAFPVAETATDV